MTEEELMGIATGDSLTIMTRMLMCRELPRRVTNVKRIQMVISRILLPRYYFSASRLLAAIKLSTRSATLSVAITQPVTNIQMLLNFK